MNILKRNYAEIESPKSGLTGEYKLVVSNADGTIAKETPWFKNIILDSGLNRWGTNYIGGGMGIGTQTSTPVSTQTGLDAEVAWTTTNSAYTTSAQGSSPYYASSIVAYRFAVGTLNGNYSEVAIGWAAGANKFSRALIVNVNGDPTTISVSSAQALDVYYKLNIYPPTSDVVNTVNISGTNYTVTTRACNVTSTSAWGANLVGTNSGFSASANSGYNVYNGAIGAITGTPSGSSLFYSAAGSTYTNNSYTAVITPTFSLTQGNLSGGISSLQVGQSYLGTFQYGFSPAIPKDSTKTLSLTVSMSWARKP